MRFSVLMTCYNHAAFVLDTVASVFAQSYQPYELIIVDDGSSDDTVALLQQNYGTHPLVKIITQANQGQTQALATAITAATGDVCTFLDGDDRYTLDYLNQLNTCYEKNRAVNFVYCRCAYIDQEGHSRNDAKEPFLGFLRDYPDDYDWGYTALLVYFSPRWVGNMTSTLSMKRTVAVALNLGTVARQFQITAAYTDNALIYGSSLLGARKYFLNQPLIEYRLHTGNAHRSVSDQEKLNKSFQSKLFESIVCSYYQKLSCLSETMREQAAAECKTVPKPHPQHRKIYEQIIERRKKSARFRRFLKRVWRAIRRK